MNIKTHILLHEDNSQIVSLTQMKFGSLKYHGHTYKFYLNDCLFEGTIKYGDGVKSYNYVGTNT
jgi:hypothetical protein